jgi:hypothetical protein
MTKHITDIVERAFFMVEVLLVFGGKEKEEGRGGGEMRREEAGHRTRFCPTN